MNVLGWGLAVLFLCLYFDKRANAKYLDDRIKSIQAKYNDLLEENKLIKSKVQEEVLPEDSNQIQEDFVKEQKLEELHVEQDLTYEPYNLEDAKRKQKERDREQKNSAILSTGAVLVVVAAIVFLTSTWSIISSPIKVAILILLLFVFLFASKIAKDTLNLPKASKAFFYISMAYIPICFSSLSILGLLGPKWSIFGEEKYTYFTIVSAITGLIYYYFYRKNKSQALFTGSLICRIRFFSIILINLW